MRGFLLGLSSGTVCAAYCAPVLVPYLLGEGRGVLKNFSALTQFLLGRLLGYLSFAVFAWGIHVSLPQDITKQNLLIGAAYLILAGLLIYYSFFKAGRACPQAGGQGTGHRLRDPRSSFFLLSLGLVTGLNLCPPFLLAVATASQQATLAQSILFFLTFFIGTSVFLIPAPLLGLLRGFPPLHVIGKMAAGLIGAYYFFIGATMLAGGFYL
ncbi:MAG: sulfite exporter TauE/SafE family protein [Deltaproteobacteria bacterium]|nr:sulfite exporter TauE/SafE family protein [Deltaproteobacteria bacterium]